MLEQEQTHRQQPSIEMRVWSKFKRFYGISGAEDGPTGLENLIAIVIQFQSEGQTWESDQQQHSSSINSPKTIRVEERIDGDSIEMVTEQERAIIIAEGRDYKEVEVSGEVKYE